MYKNAAMKAWNGMINDALHPNGFLGYVQSTGKQPSDGQPVTYDKAPNFEDYGLGAFLLAGSEIYKLVDISTDISIDNAADIVAPPTEVTLRVFSPNPFNPSATIRIIYNLFELTNLDLTIYNMQGKKIFTFYKCTQQKAGDHQVIWNGTDNAGKLLPSSSYIIQLQAGKYIRTQKLVLFK